MTEENKPEINQVQLNKGMPYQQINVFVQSKDKTTDELMDVAIKGFNELRKTEPVLVDQPHTC